MDPSRLDYAEKSLIETTERSCRPALEAEPGDFSWEYDRKAAEASIRSWGRLPELRGWTVMDEGLRRRQDTMLFHNREEELIVYDPSRVRVERVIRMPEIRDAFDLGDRVTFPWFDDDEVDVRVIR